MFISTPFMRSLLLLLSEFSLLAVVLLVSPPANAITINEFTIPTADSVPRYITAGPDGNLWFTEFTANNIARMTTAGVITEFPVSTVYMTPEGMRRVRTAISGLRNFG
jgi:streptogramin lyase